MNYEELVKALRICSSELNCGDCPLLYRDSCSSDQMMRDAAAAIEELQAQLMYATDAAKEIAEKVPKRGKWIDRYDEDDKPFFKRKYVCSACGGWNTYGKSKYCPNCGAKMEVQDEGAGSL